MSQRTRRRPGVGASVLIGATAVLAMAMSACSSDAADRTVAVTGTDDGCSMDADILEAGTIGFEFTNEADDVSELYVLRSDGDIVAEVENVTTGTSRTLTVDLVAGDYDLRCRPGQTGEGIMTAFTVTGDGGTPSAEPDRTNSFEAVDFAYPDLDVSDIVAGETIRFEMTNAGDQQHEFEVLGPDGEPLGEVAAMDPGETGGATITFDEPGEYTYQCILVDPETDQPHTELGMIGTVEVPAA